MTVIVFKQTNHGLGVGCNTPDRREIGGEQVAKERKQTRPAREREGGVRRRTTELVIEAVGDALAPLAVLDVLLPVEEPLGHLVLQRVLHDRDELLHLILRLSGHRPGNKV